ncbi:MAG: hypothetical protein OXC05_04410 [Halieaceae bacterium]|nr:hypothetical protein [Halieaceae bacterium]
MRGENGISLTGLYVFGAIAFAMLVLKLSVMDTWSWWRVILPLGLFVGFNVTNIVVAFIYLSFAQIPARPDGDEADILEPHTINAQYIAAMLFFVAFGDNMVRWVEGGETSNWFWLLSGRIETLTVFGALSVLALFSYWSRLARALKA